MENSGRIQVHYLLRAVVMFCYAGFITYLVKSGGLAYYIAPQLTPYAKFAAITLLIFAAVQIYMALQPYLEKSEVCDCQIEPPKSLLMNVLVYGIFVLPLLLGTMLPNEIQSSHLASMKGMNLQSAGRIVPQTKVTNNEQESLTQASELEQLKKLFPVQPYSEEFAMLGMKLYPKEVITLKDAGFMEILTTVDMYIEQFIGKQMSISGFVYRDETMSSEQFVVARLAMQCCSADSEPYGILVHSEQANLLPDNTWVRIEGTIEQVLYDNQTIMALHAQKIEKTTAPATPYVYPYYDDYSQLVE